MQKQFYIFTDGNCKKNGQTNAYAAYGVLFSSDPSSYLYKFNSVNSLVSIKPTNQQAELSAIQECLSILLRNKNVFTSSTVIICTDSMYAIKCITEWSTTWISNGWKNSKKKQVVNKQLVQDILALLDELRTIQVHIEFKHVLSHQSPPSNSDDISYKIWKGNYEVDALINKHLDYVSRNLI